MYVIRNKHINDAFLEIGELILKHGEHYQANFTDSYEYGPITIIQNRINDVLITLHDRKVNYVLVIAEYLYTLKGLSNDWIFNFSNTLREFTNLDITYGQRIRDSFNRVDQLGYVLNILRKDPDTRRAIITTWATHIDSMVEKHEVPCLISLNLSIRKKKYLDLVAYMRANDLMRGFQYNIFCFMMIQKLIAEILELEIGNYYHIVNRFCIFSRDGEKFNNLSRKIIDQIPYSLNNLEMGLFPIKYKDDRQYFGYIDDLFDSINAGSLREPNCLLNLFANDLTSFLKLKQQGPL